MIKCEICGSSFKSNHGLAIHIARVHNISSKTYYDKFYIRHEEGICRVCDNNTEYINLNVGYRTFCSVRCMALDSEINEKKKSTCLLRYGVDSANKCPEKNRQRELTFRKRYGSKCYFDSEKHRTWMKTGGSSYIRSFISCPSKPQVELFELVKDIYPDTILEFPIFNFNIDIDIPFIKIAIEYDGSYWHQDKEKDDKRQAKIENEGWKFLRYVDTIPNKNQLKNDIENII